MTLSEINILSLHSKQSEKVYYTYIYTLINYLNFTYKHRCDREKFYLTIYIKKFVNNYRSVFNNSLGLILLCLIDVFTLKLCIEATRLTCVVVSVRLLALTRKLRLSRRFGQKNDSIAAFIRFLPSWKHTKKSDFSKRCQINIFVQVSGFYLMEITEGQIFLILRHILLEKITLVNF